MSTILAKRGTQQKEPIQGQEQSVQTGRSQQSPGMTAREIIKEGGNDKLPQTERKRDRQGG